MTHPITANEIVPLSVLPIAAPTTVCYSINSSLEDSLNLLAQTHQQLLLVFQTEQKKSLHQNQHCFLHVPKT